MFSSKVFSWNLQILRSGNCLYRCFGVLKMIFLFGISVVLLRSLISCYCSDQSTIVIMEESGGSMKTEKLSYSNYYAWKQKINLVLTLKDLDAYMENDMPD